MYLLNALCTFRRQTTGDNCFQLAFTGLDGFSFKVQRKENPPLAMRRVIWIIKELKSLPEFLIQLSTAIKTKGKNLDSVRRIFNFSPKLFRPLTELDKREERPEISFELGIIRERKSFRWRKNRKIWEQTLGFGGELLQKLRDCKQTFKWRYVLVLFAGAREMRKKNFLNSSRSHWSWWFAAQLMSACSSGR